MSRQEQFADELLSDVVLLCISRLSEKFLHDNTLFVAVAALPDVKDFQKVLLGSVSDNSVMQKVMNEQKDPIIVVGVLIKCLKDTKFCVMHELYEELMSIDLKEERKRITTATRGLLIRLNHQKFNLVKSLFYMLHRLATSHPNDHTYLHLANTTAPLLCRLVDSAYMSIRHEEDLRRIKPVIAYMIENVRDIFTNDLIPNRATLADQADSGANSPRKLSRNTNGLPDRAFGGPAPSTLQSRAGSSSSGEPSSSTNQFNLRIQTSSSASSAEDASVQSRHSNIYSGTWEWAVFQSIVFSHVHGVVAGTSKGDAAPSPTLTSSGASRRKTKHPISEQENDNTLNKQVKSSSSSNIRSTASSYDSEQLPSKIFTKKISRLQNRKTMVADCRNLKSQISNFESDWKSRHNRAPKSSDRGAMQSVYTQYKVLKLNIRDHAAADIQRVARGCLVRTRLGKLSRMMSVMPPPPGAAGPCTDEADVVYMDVAAQDTPPSSTQATGSLPPDVYNKYKDLLSQKRDLKKRLKRFDSDFEKQTGRAPKKSDKEVMRPMYQRYHEVKQSLDDLKVAVEATYGPLPPELLEDGAKPGATRDLSFNAVLAKSADDSDMLKPSSGSSSLNLHSLQEEKKHLHLYLKSYEKDFISRNGRPVTRPEDIAPVAREYQRYKDIKGMIAEAASAL